MRLANGEGGGRRIGLKHPGRLAASTKLRGAETLLQTICALSASE